MAPLLGVAGIVAVILVVVARRPAAYHVERALEITAPVDDVYGVLAERLASVLVLFGEPWDGKGALTIEERVPQERVRAKLELTAPMKSTATYTFTLAATSTGTRVTAAMDGTHNFVGKAMGVLMDMDKALGADLEKTLARLRT